MESKEPEEWERSFQSSLRHGGRHVILGGVDTGKSSFIRWLANRALQEGTQSAIIDADMGQSDIGPPSTIGLGIVQKAFCSFDKIPVQAIHFVGCFSPRRHLLQSMIGIEKLRRISEKCDVPLLIVNTTGWITDCDGIAYKQGKIDLLDPQSIIAFEKERELHPILSPYRKMNRPRIIRLPLHPGLREKSPEKRQETRLAKLAKYFRDSILIRVSLKKTAVSEIGWDALLEMESPGNLVAMIDSQNRTLAIGRVLNIDRKNLSLEIQSPPGIEPDNIKRIGYSSLKIDF